MPVYVSLSQPVIIHPDRLHNNFPGRMVSGRGDDWRENRQEQSRERREGCVSGIGGEKPGLSQSSEDIPGLKHSA